jgi:MFS transporter, DHA1 family, tetracycline resistance protein
MCFAIQSRSFGVLFASLTTVTVGFSFVTPSLFGLISRRTDPTRQGRVLGVSQSIAALARIVGPTIGIVFISINLSYPYYLAIGLLSIGLIMLLTLKNAPERAADPTAEENLLVH